MGKGLQRWLRPLPMGLLAALLSALVLLPTLLGVADWQAGRAEQRELELLRQHSAQRIGDFFASLYASLERVEALSAERCSAGSRDELQQRAAAELFVVGFSRTLPDGRSCRTLRLPSAQALQGYRHWRLDDVDIWWQPQRLQDPLQPSLVLGRGEVKVASSLRFLWALMQMPAGTDSRLIGPDGQVLDLEGETSLLGVSEGRLLQYPQTLQHRDGRTHLLGAGDRFGLRLLISRADQQLLEQRRTLRALWSVAGLLLAALLGWLVALLLRRDQSLARALEQALRRDEFELDYQPLVDLASGRCVGAEALLRWRRADGQRVRPDLFIPQAEDSGQITAITRWVIRQVLQEQGELLRQHPQLYISVNLAAADLVEARFPAEAQAALQAAGVPPAQLVYEVTERGLVDPQRAVAVLEPLRQAGHRIAIDDFGTGYSSLSYLQQLPVDVLKIDKSFVDALGTEAASSPVAPHIIAMARALGLKVIAEGVEQAEQARLLAELGAQIGQGWLFAKPLSGQAFRDFVAAH